MSLYSKVANLPLKVDSYKLEGLSQNTSSGFERLSTVIALTGDGVEGLGEDVTYDSEDHIALQRHGPSLPLSGNYSLGEFTELIESLDLFPEPPQVETSRLYRRWAFEAAALDLALRQNDLSLAQALGLKQRPVQFVVSLRLGEPPSLLPVLNRLELYPELRFKLDPTSSWTDEIFAGLKETGAVDSVDLKGAYKGTIVDQPPDPELYRKVVETFPEAWIEDPALTPDTEPILLPHRERITWDAPIHSVEEIESLPFKPRTLNFKPSRFGSIERLFAAYEYCRHEAIEAYSGGQFELGVGRGQIQYLASLFHPDTPNDLAPGGYNLPVAPANLPTSPLQPQSGGNGFRWQ